MFLKPGHRGQRGQDTGRVGEKPKIDRAGKEQKNDTVNRQKDTTYILQTLLE
jgi:hypothetical protein